MPTVIDEFVNRRGGSTPIVGVNNPAPSFEVTATAEQDTPGAPKTINATENGGVPAEDIFDWNSLAVGQKINGGTVLDASVFQNLFGDIRNADVGLNYSGESLIAQGAGTRSFDTSKNTELGGTFGGRTDIGLYGFKPVELDVVIDPNKPKDKNRYTLVGEERAANIQKLATEAGLDLANYTKTVPGAFVGTGDSYEWNPGSSTVDETALARDINKANYTKLASAPDAVFYIDSTQNTGSDKDRQRTWYTQKEDRLVPLESKGYYQGHDWVDGTRGGVAFLASVAIGGAAAPYISAAAGGGATGAVVAGGTIGGTQAALSGGSTKDILKGIALGAATAGFSQYASPSISAAVGGGDLGNVAAGVAKTGFTSLLQGSNSSDLGKNVISAIIKNSGVQGAGILDVLVKYGMQSQAKKG